MYMFASAKGSFALLYISFLSDFPFRLFSIWHALNVVAAVRAFLCVAWHIFELIGPELKANNEWLNMHCCRAD